MRRYDVICTGGTTADGKAAHPERMLGELRDSRRETPPTYAEVVAEVTQLDEFLGLAPDPARVERAARNLYVIAREILFLPTVTRRSAAGLPLTRSSAASMLSRDATSGTGRVFEFTCQTCKRTPRLAVKDVETFIDGTVGPMGFNFVNVSAVEAATRARLT